MTSEEDDYATLGFLTLVAVFMVAVFIVVFVIPMVSYAIDHPFRMVMIIAVSIAGAYVFVRFMVYVGMAVAWVIENE